MSKSGKLKKKAENKARKQAKRDRYKALAGERSNLKTSKRRSRRASANKKLNVHGHGPGICGNPACRRCFPDPNRPKFPNKHWAAEARAGVRLAVKEHWTMVAKEGR